MIRCRGQSQGLHCNGGRRTRDPPGLFLPHSATDDLGQVVKAVRVSMADPCAVSTITFPVALGGARHPSHTERLRDNILIQVRLFADVYLELLTGWCWSPAMLHGVGLLRKRFRSAIKWLR